MRVILSEAKDLTHNVRITRITKRDQRNPRGVPRRLRDSG
jgi:hypothetical protein